MKNETNVDGLLPGLPVGNLYIIRDRLYDVMKEGASSRAIIHSALIALKELAKIMDEPIPVSIQTAEASIEPKDKGFSENLDTMLIENYLKENVGLDEFIKSITKSYIATCWELGGYTIKGLANKAQISIWRAQNIRKRHLKEKK